MQKPFLWITINCGRFWKKWEYQTTWPASRNLYAGLEATVKTGHGKMDWFQIGKKVHQGCALLPCLFNLYSECIMWNARLDESQAGIKITRRNITNFRYADYNHSNGRKWRTKEPLDEGERGGCKCWLKSQIMATGPITSWQKEREILETVADFIFSGSKITVDGDWGREI